MEDLQIVIHKRWKTSPEDEPTSTGMADQLRHDCSKHIVLVTNNHVCSLVVVVSLRQLFFSLSEITAPTLWIKHLVIKDSKLNSSSIRNSGNVLSKKKKKVLLTRLQSLTICSSFVLSVL